MVMTAAASRSSMQLVEDALLDERLAGALSRDRPGCPWKEAVHELRRRPPDRECAQVVVEASRDPRIPGWLTAALLGALRHPVGYRTVLDLLRAGLDQYTGGALVAMRGAEAFPDLAGVLQAEGLPWSAYEAAARGLGEIADPRVPDLLAAAVVAVPEKIRPSVAGHAMSKQALDPARLLAWLAGDSIRLRSVAVRAVGHRPSGEALPAPLRAAVLAELEREILFIGQAERDLIRARLAAPA
jgi:hypothetical protein